MGAFGAGGQRGGDCGAAGEYPHGSGAVSAGRGGVFYGADVENLADAAKDEKGSLKKMPRSVELRGVFVFNPYGELNIKMNKNNDKPININCKAEFGMKLITKAKLSEDGAKEVWSKVADNFRLPILLLAIGCLFALMCLGISLIKWW